MIIQLLLQRWLHNLGVLSCELRVVSCNVFLKKKNKESDWLLVSAAKLLEHYSSNLDMQIVDQF